MDSDEIIRHFGFMGDESAEMTLTPTVNVAMELETILYRIILGVHGAVTK